MSYEINRITNCITCGGELQVNGKGVPTCPYCGRQYKDGVDSFSQELEEIVKRRQLREFIQAEELCRELLSKQPESSEAYWQTVLSTLGVVYVVDPETDKAKPTFFSYSYDDRDTIENNKDYKKAIQYADSRVEKEYYVAQAQELDRLLKDFFNLVAKEDSYDIFISFKRTTKATVNGETRDIDTDDYKKAQEIYDYFSKKYKVFFSPVSIGSDTGIEGEKYEPRILKALQTSQAMILLGSTKEYVEAQWVQNEWRRFQFFINKGKKQKNSLIFVYDKNMPPLPSALKDIQLPSVDWFKATYLRELESKLTFVKTSKGIQSKIKERKISTSFDSNDNFAFQSKGERFVIGKNAGSPIEISASEKREMESAFASLKGQHYKDAQVQFSEILKKNPASYKAYWGRFRTNIRASNELTVPDCILYNGTEDYFKDAAQAIDCSTDEVFSWQIVDFFISALKNHNGSQDISDWTKKKPIFDFVQKYLDDDRLTQVREIIKEHVYSYLHAGNVNLADNVFAESRKLYFEEDRDILINEILNFADKLFIKLQYELAKKYYGEIASVTKTSFAYWRLLCCRLQTKDASKVKITLDKPGEDETETKKITELSARELIERTIVCIDKEDVVHKYSRKKDDSTTGIGKKITDMVLFQIVNNKKRAENMIEEVANCYLQLNNEKSANDLFMAVAERYIQLKDFTHAKRYYDEVLSRDPNYSKAHWGLLLCRFKVQDEKDLCKKSGVLMQTPEFINAKNCATDEEFKHYTSVYNGNIPFSTSPYKKNPKRTDGMVSDPNRQAYLHFTKGKRTLRKMVVLLLVLFIAALGGYAAWGVTNPIAYADGTATRANFICRTFYSEITLGSANDDSVQAVGANCFKNSRLKTVTLDVSITEIGAEAFRGSKNLEQVTIKGESVGIGAFAFADCPKLKNVVFEGSVASLDDGAFKNVSASSIAISGVKYLGANVFSGNSYLQSLEIGCDDSLTVDSAAFDGLPETAIVYIPSVLPELLDKISGDNPSLSLKTYTADAEKECEFFINEIGAVSLESGSAIEKAETLYAALTDMQKERITNLDVLLNARTIYDVMSAIDSIGDVTLDSEDVIEDAERLYYKLKKSQRELITNFDVLSSARSVLNVEIAIYKLDNITTSSESAIKKAEKAYNELSENERNAVSNADDLVNARARFEALWSYLSTDTNIADAGTYTIMENDKIAIGNKVTLTASSKAGYTWLGWYDGETKLSENDSLSYTFDMPAENKTYTATWTYYTVTIDQNILEGGTVWAEYDNSSLLNGQRIVRAGSRLTLYKQTNPGYTFVGWFNENDVCFHTGNNNINVEMTAENLTLTAKWIPYPITIEKNIQEAGSIIGMNDTTYIGESITLTAQTNVGYTWLGWFDGETKVSEDTSYSYNFTLTQESKIYTAKWIPCPITLEKNIQEAGSIIGMNDTTYIGEAITLTAESNPGYTWLGWYDGETKVSESNNLSYTFNMPTESKIYTAKWIVYTISTQTNLSDAGTYTLKTDEKVTAGDSVTLTAEPYSGYTFQGWYDGETKVNDSESLTYTFNMPAKTIIYTAKWIAYTVSTQTNLLEAGTYTIKTDEKVTAGDSVTLTAETNTGYTWLGWFDGETKVSEGDSLAYTFNMPAENKTYTAKWIVYTISTQTNLSEAGTYTVKTDENVTAGDSVTLTAETNVGYTWLGWFDGETKVSEDDSLTYTFNMPAENKTYTAKWILYTISTQTNLSEAGTYTVKTDENVTAGDSVTLTAETNVGYTWLGWFDGETKVSEDNSLTYTFNMPAESKIYTATWTINEEMQNFTFSSTPASCTISGVKDKSITEIVIPDYVNTIGEGSLSGCSALETLTIPFVGAEANKTSNDTYQYPLGYIFGTSSYDGGIAVSQYFYASSTDRTTSTNYYLPSSLRNVTVTGGNILSGAFYNCKSLTYILLPSNITNIESKAFYNCNMLPSVTIPSSVTSIEKDAFYNCYKLVEVYNKSSLIITKGSSSNGYVGYYAKNVYSEPNGSKLSTDENGFIIYTDGTLKSLIGYVGAAQELTIPSYVTEIYKYAFYNNINITSITIQSSVTSIGVAAFQGCSSINSICYAGDIDSWFSIKQLDNLMIYGSSNKSLYINDTKVTNLVIPEGITSIPSSTFCRCTDLTSVTIPSSVTSIGVDAFYGCTSLSSIYYEGNLVGWFGIEGLSEFMICGSSNKSLYLNGTEVTNLEIPEGITSIPSNAFYNCADLTSARIPSSVTSIGGYPFYGCSILSSIYYEGDINLWCEIDGLKYLMDNGLSNKSLYINGKRVEGDFIIPDGVTNIAPYSFYNCTGLTSVTIASRVTTIGGYSFYNCTGLTSITIPPSVTSIGSSAFYNCTGLTSITGSASFVGSIAKDCKATSFNVIINSGARIYGSAFYGCTGLTSVTIPASVTSIDGYQLFSGCTSLSSIYYEGDIAAWCEIDGLRYLMTYDISLYINEAKIEGNLEIPEGVTSIPSYAFYKCTGLTSVTIPASVTSIGDCAFFECTSLTSLNFAENSQLKSIGTSAFKNCNNLHSIVIPSSVTSIGQELLSGCSNIENLTIPFVGAKADKTSNDTYQYPLGYIFGTSSYDGSTNVQQQYYDTSYSTTSTTYYIPSSLRNVTVTGGNILYGAFYNCSLLTSIVITSNITKISSYAFYGCTGLTSITLPSNLGSINEYTFSGCTNLKSINIPSNVTEIGRYAFNDCIGLKSVTIPSGIKSIWSYAFSGCTSLSSIYYEGDLAAWCRITQLENLMRYGLSNKSLYINGVKIEGDLEIPEGVTSIPSYAFYGCTGLTSVTIPSIVTSIGDYAFYGCKGLTSITIPSSVTSIKRDAFSGCTSLSSIYYEGNLVGWVEIEGLFNLMFFGSSNRMLYINGTKVTNLEIPEDVTSIPSYAFYKCTDLTSVSIPSTVTYIGDSAFSGCTNLASITISPNIKNVIIIKSNIFSGCTGLTSITGPASYVALIAKNCYATSFSVNINSDAEIEERAFYGCSGLVSVTILSSVTIIGKEAFYNCTGLTSVTISSSVTSIEPYAFSGCSKLTSVTFENTSGWYTTTSSTATSGANMNVTNASNNATYLRVTYKNYYWKKRA